MIGASYNFQIDKNAVPVFYINKGSWNDNYKRIIRECTYYRMAYLLCEPDDKSKPYMEITCMCLKDFEDFISGIEKYIGIES